MKSDADFDTCVGCIDGLLIWMHLPSLKESGIVRVGQTKFYCGRKHKFGLNLQAVCDHKRRFLALSIIYGASSSDLLAFEGSPLRVQLEKEGFLAPGLCLFGDNAYVNREFMATPYPNVSSHEEKDAYNFFHSQLRINIECAFGMLVQRWGVLKKKAPQKYTVKKIIATVSCLCSLHNFLINSKASAIAVATTTIDPPTPQDALTLAVEGAVDVTPAAAGREDDDVRVDELTGGGHHFDDDPNYILRRRISQSYGPVVLTREAMFAHVVNRDLHRTKRNIDRNGRRA